jgi:hypothetical protein
MSVNQPSNVQRLVHQALQIESSQLAILKGSYASGTWKRRNHQHIPCKRMPRSLMGWMVAAGQRRAMGPQRLQHVAEMDVCGYGILAKKVPPWQRFSQLTRRTLGAITDTRAVCCLQLCDREKCFRNRRPLCRRDCWSVAFGNSFNDEERCVLAGYDNGDVKLFDLRMNQVRVSPRGNVTVRTIQVICPHAVSYSW